MAQQIYNAPTSAGANPSSVGPQLRIDHYYKKALVEIAKEQYFSQMADVRAMPKNMGKSIKQFHYIPILDDQNINDQGLDADGTAILTTEYGVTVPELVCTPTNYEPDAGVTLKAYAIGDYVYDGTTPFGYSVITTAVAVGGDATAAGANATAVTEAAIKALIEADTVGVVATVPTYATASGLSVSGLDMVFSTEAAAIKVLGIIAGSSSFQRSGNLYASSKDIGTISGKFPVLSETGGRVNRVGMKRKTIEGVISKYGFFDEYTQESLDFDSDSELEQHIVSESVKAANEIYEDQLQMDLINGAGVIRYTGTATSKLTLQGNDAASPFAVGNTNDLVTYDDLVKLGIVLDQNRTPTMTKIISGSRMVDTKTINAARYLYVGSELTSSLMRMTDYHGNQAFIPVAQYAAAGNIARGEIGSIDKFRIIVVPEMMKDAGAGAAVTTNGGFYETNGKFDAFPMLVVGDGSFTTIGFQTDGKSTKFKVKHSKPGSPESYANDPYGETGFHSIKWYFGTMILRPERLAITWTIAEQ